MGAMAERMAWIEKCINELDSILKDASVKECLSRFRYLAMILYLL